MSLSSSIAGWSLIYQNRPERLDEEYENLRQREKELNEGVQQTLLEVQEIAQRQINEAMEEMETKLQQAYDETNHWQHMYFNATQPIPPKPCNTTAALNCREVQRAFAHPDFGIIMDVGKTQQPTNIPDKKTPHGEYQVFTLNPRNQDTTNNYIKHKSKLVEVAEVALEQAGRVSIQRVGEQFVVKFIPGMKTATQEAEEIELKKQ